MPKYQHDPLAVHPQPPSFTPEELERRTAEMWSEQLERSVKAIAKAAKWNERTGGIEGMHLDCLQVAALHKHLSQRGSNIEVRHARANNPTAPSVVL